MANDQPAEAPQVKLDDKLVLGYIAAQKDVSAYLEKVGQPMDEVPDPKVQAALEGIARKHGFAGFAAFDDVAYNVSLVLGGLDPQSGAFTDPTAALRQEIAAVTADRSLPAAEKREMLDALGMELQAMPRKLQFAGNVEVVKRHIEALEDLQ